MRLVTSLKWYEPYDKLILSAGAAPTRPDVPGVDLDGIWTLRDVGDAERIKRWVDQGIHRAVVVGGGYIGLEMVESLTRRGVATTVMPSRDRLLTVFDPEGGRVLGAQAVGGSGTNKRIDVLATAIQARMTVFDRAEAELIYAPQYGAADDLINKAGFIALEVIEGEHPQVDVADLPERVLAEVFVLDVR